MKTQNSVTYINRLLKFEGNSCALVELRVPALQLRIHQLRGKLVQVEGQCYPPPLLAHSGNKVVENIIFLRNAQNNEKSTRF